MSLLIDSCIFCILFSRFVIIFTINGASLVAQRVKRLFAMQETWVWSLGQEDPLEKEMATHSRTLAWKIPWIEKPGRLQSMGSQRVGHDWVTSLQCLYVESRKMVLKNLFAAQQWRNRYREETYGHGERGGQSEMYGVSNMETYIIICKIDSEWKFAVCLKELKQGSVST